MTTSTAKFDADAMREKYRVERDKRIREDGNDQYLEVVGDFSRYVDDPYIKEKLNREPVSSEVDVLLIGGGFGGLQAGARLREAGVKDICVVEKGGDFGGTWYWNRYPGAQCDVESYIYLPLLEELDYVPTQKYSQAPEILAHSQAIGRHYNLYDNALFQTEVTDTRWDEDSSRWIVSTNRGDTIKARFIAMANGPLNRPKLPAIKGISDFKGHTFHTSRWDYDYTGGDANGGLDGLHDKRVAIIGTGATAVQCVPHVGASAKQLYLFQRTPSGVDVRDNSKTDPDWAAELTTGWHRERMENFNSLVSGVPMEEDMVNDGWTDLIGKMIRMFHEGASGDTKGRSLPEILEDANFEKMNEIRARAEQLVDDPDTAEALKPYYKMFCKRPCFHDEYLQTFNRPNVTLVDTDGQGVDEITEKGVVVNGTEYEVDCIIFATGFEVGTSYARRAGYEITGRTGRTLTDKWNEGVRSLHGMQSREFPNCFIMSQTQGGFTVNYPHMLDEVAVHIAYIISHALENDIEKIEVSEEAEEAWVQTILEKGTGGAALGGEGCTPGYYSNEGKPNPLFAQAAPYGGGPIPFFNLLREWRDAEDFAGLEFDSK
jgi:cation diffusion facilitator CzcD-associated flavoprotein CzcO